ncbi:MAG: hypothetical protein OES32_03000 [Acidobacteriota bacterium]|nr:hypothetical protein [Acidobacteriota bacterium]
MARVYASGEVLVVSGTEFPDARRVGLVESGAMSVEVDGQGRWAAAAAPDGPLWGVVDRVLPATNPACLAFRHKDRFTWASDLSTYVRYWAGEVLPAIRALDPSVDRLEISDRTVRLEVEQPGVGRAVLAGVEGGMLGFGRLEDPERFLFLPVVLNEATGRVAVRVMRIRGTAFGQGGTETLGWALADASEPSVTETEPRFRLRVAGVE